MRFSTPPQPAARRRPSTSWVRSSTTCCSKSPGLQEIFNSLVIGRDEKIRLIDKVIAPRASELVTNFLRVLARHGRLDLLPAILRESRIRNEIRHGRRRIQVTSARPLDSRAEGRIRTRLAESLPFDPILETRVDPSLLGGIVIRVGDTVYDSSLATRIKQLREQLSRGVSMKFKADEIASVLQKEIEDFRGQLDDREVGRVLEVGDGIARSTASPRRMAGEMVEFPNGVSGLAFNLEENSVGVIILGDYLEIAEGDEVKTTGRLLTRAGRRRAHRPRGRSAGQSAGRQGADRHQRAPARRVHRSGHRRPPAGQQPLQTGIKAIDAMTPIGRGQRELIIGDRKTGKTAIGIDAIINQKGGDVKCFYVACGQKESTVAGVVEVLREHGAMDYTIVVGAGAQRSGPAAIRRSVCRHGDGRALHVAGEARADRLRRPFEAGPGLSAVVAVDAASARARGVSGRRVLLPTAGCSSGPAS